MKKDYFEELYECKKELLNELLVLRQIIDALSYSGLKPQISYYEKRIQELNEDLKDMEVDLKT